jgi:hypothetical protein
MGYTATELRPNTLCFSIPRTEYCRHNVTQQSVCAVHISRTRSSRFSPEGLFNHSEDLRSTFPKNGTKFDAHSLFLSLIHRENRHMSRTRLQINAYELPTSTQVRATWHTDSLYMVVLPSTGASRYYNCCIDGGTSPEYFENHLVYNNIFRIKYSCGRRSTYFISF